MEASTTQEEVRDVPLGEAFAEAQGIDQEGDDQEHPRPRPQKSENDVEDQKAKVAEDLDILTPKSGAREWTIGSGQAARTYIQRELSVIGKAQWFALVGEVLDDAMSGDSALSLRSLFEMPTMKAGERFQVQDFKEADLFVQAIGKLLVIAPKFLEESVCIWLNVPDYEWALVKDLMRESPAEGGMDDDTFEEILATFIDQNYTAIDRFFRERSQRLRARYQARAKEASQSRSSKR